ncbi:hypothetical protein [Thalassotalea sp. PLHSN55]|uniref:hypothetical protein n=1 Tax=Thalassotalea sp. PLHSN55 TaxID=3435888 RepID=UPI003F860830
MKKLSCSVLILLALSACTSKQLYQAGQGQQRSQCINDAATADEHRACLNQEQKSFEEYERERQALEQSNQKHKP